MAVISPAKAFPVELATGKATGLVDKQTMTLNPKPPLLARVMRLRTPTEGRCGVALAPRSATLGCHQGGVGHIFNHLKHPIKLGEFKNDANGGRHGAEAEALAALAGLL